MSLEKNKKKTNKMSNKTRHKSDLRSMCYMNNKRLLGISNMNQLSKALLNKMLETRVMKIDKPSKRKAIRFLKRKHKQLEM